MCRVANPSDRALLNASCQSCDFGSRHHLNTLSESNPYALASRDSVKNRFETKHMKDLTLITRLLDPTYPITAEEYREFFDEDSISEAISNIYCVDEFPRPLANFYTFLKAFRKLRMSNYFKLPASTTIHTFWANLKHYKDIPGRKDAYPFIDRLINVHVTTVPIERIFSLVSTGLTKFDKHMGEDLFFSRLLIRAYTSRKAETTTTTHTRFTVDSTDFVMTMSTRILQSTPCALREDDESFPQNLPSSSSSSSSSSSPPSAFPMPLAGVYDSSLDTDEDESSLAPLRAVRKLTRSVRKQKGGLYAGLGFDDDSSSDVDPDDL